MATVPHSTYLRVGQGEVDFANDSFKVALMTSSWSPPTDDEDNPYWTNTNEITDSAGDYTPGGEVLDNTAWVSNDTSNAAEFSADPETLTGSTIADYQYAVIYDDTHVNDLIVSITDFGSAQSITDTDLTLTMPTVIFSITHA